MTTMTTSHAVQLQSMLAQAGVQLEEIKCSRKDRFAFGFVPQQYSGCFAFKSNLRIEFLFNAEGTLVSATAEEVGK